MTVVERVSASFCFVALEKDLESLISHRYRPEEKHNFLDPSITILDSEEMIQAGEV